MHYMDRQDAKALMKRVHQWLSDPSTDALIAKQFWSNRTHARCVGCERVTKELGGIAAFVPTHTTLPKGMHEVWYAACWGCSCQEPAVFQQMARRIDHLIEAATRRD